MFSRTGQPTRYGSKRRTAAREKSILDNIETEMARMFVEELDGIAVGGCHEGFQQDESAFEVVGSNWTEDLRTCPNGRDVWISGSTICAALSHSGTR